MENRRPPITEEPNIKINHSIDTFAQKLDEHDKRKDEKISIGYFIDVWNLLIDFEEMFDGRSGYLKSQLATENNYRIFQNLLDVIGDGLASNILKDDKKKCIQDKETYYLIHTKVNIYFFVHWQDKNAISKILSDYIQNCKLLNHNKRDIRKIFFKLIKYYFFFIKSMMDINDINENNVCEFLRDMYLQSSDPNSKELIKNCLETLTLPIFGDRCVKNAKELLVSYKHIPVAFTFIDDGSTILPMAEPVPAPTKLMPAGTVSKTSESKKDNNRALLYGTVFSNTQTKDEKAPKETPSSIASNPFTIFTQEDMLNFYVSKKYNAKEIAAIVPPNPDVDDNATSMYPSLCTTNLFPY